MTKTGIKTVGAALIASCCATSAMAMPINDLIENAVALNPSDAFLTGTTVDATTDFGAPFAGTSVTSPGVWYSFFGNGGDASFDTNAAQTSFDTKLSVYTDFTGTLADLTAVGGNDDSPNCGLSAIGALCSAYSFSATAGEQYYLLVHAFGGAVGTFGLNYEVLGRPVQAQVPLPATAALLGLGLLTLRLRQRR